MLGHKCWRDGGEQQAKLLAVVFARMWEAQQASNLLWEERPGWQRGSHELVLHAACTLFSCSRTHLAKFYLVEIDHRAQ